MGPGRLFAGALALALTALIAGCGSGISHVTLYPFNNAKQSEINACKATVAKEPSLSAQLKSALEANCSNPKNTSAVKQAIQQVVAKQCQAAASQPGLPAAVATEIKSACAQGGKPSGSAQSVAAQTCQQIVKSTVPAALQPAALAKCPKS